MSCVEEVSLVETCVDSLGKEITQDDWDAFMEEGFWSDKPLDLEEYLQKKGFSRVIRGITNSSMDATRLKVFHCHFIDCDFNKTTFSQGIFEGVSFTNCNLQSSIFYDVQAEDIHFNDCQLSHCCLNQAKLHNIHINGNHHSSLEGMTFLGAQISGDSSIHHCSLQNVIFSGNLDSFYLDNCIPHEITRPIIGIGMNLFYPATFASIEVQAVRKFGGIPLLYMHYPIEVSAKDLKNSVSRTLETARPQNLSRAQWILENPRNEFTIEKVKNYAKEFFSHIDGLILPGGDDVPTLLYGGSEDYSSNGEVLRSVVEFALLELCETYSKPTMGICRGCQIMNVFLDGTLANYPWKTGPLEIDPSIQKKPLIYPQNAPYNTFIDSLLKQEEIHALSLHDQAAKKLGKTVTPILWKDEVMKLSFAKEGLFILSQVHPEILVYHEIGQEFKEKANTLKKLKEGITSLEGEYNSTDENLKWILEKTENLFNGDYYDLIDELGLDNKRPDHEYCWFESDEEIYSFILENKEKLCLKIDSHLKSFNRAEKNFDHMLSFSRNLMNLFFDNVQGARIQIQEVI